MSRKFTTAIELLAGDPSADEHAARKLYVDNRTPVDPAAGTAGVRTLGTGAQQAAAGNHNHSATYQPLDSDLTTIAGLTATTDNFMVAASSAWASRTPSQAKTALAIAVADVSGAAPLASPTFTGTVTVPRVITPPVALTDAATIAVDASLGNHFRVTLGGNRTLGNPTNSVDGQKILVEVIQDGTGSRTLAYGSNFAFGTDVTSPTLSTGANKVDYLGFVYNSAATKWRCLAVAKGY